MGSANFSAKKRTHELIEIGGLTPFTSIDYPGQLSTVLFLQGCPWRCLYCHNESLLSRQGSSVYRWDDVVEFLGRRTGLIDAVVFSGGEPTLQSGLEQAIHEVKSLGFKIGIHTAGVYPNRLEKLLPLLDWIGLDIKSSIEQYEAITGVSGSGQRAWLSAQMVVDSGVDYEVRTTLHPLLLEPGNLQGLMTELKQLGVAHYSLQRCNLEFCAPDYDAGYRSFSVNSDDLELADRCFTHFTYRDQALVTYIN